MIWAINVNGESIGNVPDEIRADIFYGVKA